MIRKSCATLLLVFSGLSSAQAATFIEIYGGISYVKPENWNGYHQNPPIPFWPQPPTFKGQTASSFYLGFFDNNNDYIFNNGDTLLNEEKYEDVNHSGPAAFSPVTKLNGGVNESGDVFLDIYVDQYNHVGETKDFIELKVTANTHSKTANMIERAGDNDQLYLYYKWQVAYDLRFDGRSQVVPLPWSAALLPAGLALLGGFGRRRRVIG